MKNRIPLPSAADRRILTRRTILRGAGLALGLPLLEATTPMARSGFAAARKSDVPMGRVEEFREHARLMFDIMPIAFQTDTTRVATMMLDNAGGNRSYTELGVKESHHGLSHHRNDPETVDQLKRIDRHLMEQFAYFLEKLDGISDGNGTHHNLRSNPSLFRQPVGPGRAQVEHVSFGSAIAW